MIVHGKVDKIKEHIGWLKIVFGILSAINIALVGWLVTNYDQPDINVMKINIGVIIVLMISMAIVYINKKAMNKIDELEDL